VWIEGAGLAVRSLLTQHQGERWYRCLSDYNREQHFISIEGG
jgi:hypothetical protein